VFQVAYVVAFHREPTPMHDVVYEHGRAYQRTPDRGRARRKRIYPAIGVRRVNRC